MKRKNPQTSLDAYNSLQPEQVREVYTKIIEALKVLGTASTEQIADYTTLPHAKIHKRVSEMERLEMIYRPGNRVPTKAGRSAHVWCLRNNQPKVETEKSQKQLKGQKSIAEYSRSITKLGNQQKLF